MAEARETAARGRPRKYAGKRPNWTIRLQEQYGQEIKAIAEKSGRSISEVCESLISQALCHNLHHAESPTFVVVTAPRQQDEELQIAAICLQALQRAPFGNARSRVLAYIASRANEAAT